MGDILYHQRVAAGGAAPGRWLPVLHGLLGSGRNWLSVARRIVERRPDWGVLLVDLREHGRSVGLPGPHTITSAAHDIGRLITSLGVSAPAVLGHSFGGKVALAHAVAARATRAVFIVDSVAEPTGDGGPAGHMLSRLRRMPAEYTSREAAVEALQAAAVERPVAQWMAMNLVQNGDVFRWRMSLEAVEALYESFRAEDLTDLVRANPQMKVHAIRGTESTVVPAAAGDRWRSLGDHVVLHEVAGGHWLNVDNPAEVVRIVAEHLPA